MHKYKQKNIIKKFVLVFLFVVCGAFISLAQELKLKGFIHLDGNTTARINKRRDVNGQYCAIIIIKHNFKDFKVESGKDYEHLEEKIGETWVWVSPDEYQIVIRKEGYIPFRYSFKDKLKELETYELIITDEFGFLKVEALGSTIWLNNNQVGKNNYKTRLKKGDYVLKATKRNHEDDKKLVTINAGEEIVINLEPIPYRANVIIESNPSDAIGSSIFINDSLINNKSPAIIPLTLGEYKITLKKHGFIDNSRIIELKDVKNYPLVFDMRKLITNPTILKHKRNSNIWLISTIISGGTAIYSYSKMNKLYDEYQVATSNAEDIHNKYKTYETLYPITIGTAGVCLTNFIIQKVKQKKAKNKLNFTYNIGQNTNSIGLCYIF